MSWPQATEYNAAVQSPRVSFADPDLRQAEAVGDLFGLPRPHSGNFADVYQMRGPGGQSWAVKCFTREVSGLRERYQAVSEHLHQARRAFTVEFDYLEQGIRIRGRWFPVLKMRWVEGFRLNEFVREHLDKPVLLDRLAQVWLRLAQELREARIGHGDLQHGNVLLVPATSGTSLGLRLVDYDGMFVPSLADRPSGEAGHPHYQHPDRLREGYYGGEVDRFSHLVIYTALRCLVRGGRHLWERYDNGENLLFREEDFRAPGRSRLFRELWGQHDLAVRALVGHLLLAARAPLGEVPRLQDLAGHGAVQPLTALEEARVRALLQGVEEPAWTGGLTPRRSPAAPGDDIPVRVVAPVFPGQPAAPPVPPAPPAPARPDTLVDVAMADTAVAVPVLPPAPPPAPPPVRPRRTKNEERRTIRIPHSAFSVLRSPFLILPWRPWRLGGSLSRRLWAVGVGTALVLVPLTWLIVALCRPADPQAPARLPRLRALPAVTMKGGAKFTLDVVVERQGCTLPLTVTVEGLPDQVTPRPLTLVPGEESGGLELAATADAEAASRRVVVALRAGERKVSEQAVKLTVEKLVRPRPAAPRTEEEPPPPRPVVNSLAGGRRTEPAELTLEVKKPVAAVPRPPSPPPVLPARPVSFATADGVTLRGTFYPVPRAREAVCVLMLHELGGGASEGWKGLAEALQARGHAVLDFDFRGYGPSTGFSPRTFWGCRENRALLPARIIPSTPMPAALNAATFPKTYYPWLVQDVAAARLYLEAKNDAGEVNSARLVLLGAGEGATLGALWLVWECCRYEPDPGARPGARRFRPEPEARDVLAALWVRMALTLGGVPMLRQPGWLRAAGRQRIPMKFLYAEQDVLSGRAQRRSGCGALVLATGGRLCHVGPNLAKTEPPALQGLVGHLCHMASIRGGCGTSLRGTTWHLPRTRPLPHRPPPEKTPPATHLAQQPPWIRHY